MEGGKMNEIETVKQEVMSIPDQAKTIIVKDSKSLTMANEFFLTIKALRKKIGDTFNPIIQKANEAHKEAINQKKIIEAPLLVAEQYLNVQVTAYKREQDRIRREEEERLRRQAIKDEAERRQKEEDESLTKAAELEAAGATEEAEALIAEAIDEKEKPLNVTVPPPETPKVKLEGATVVEYWHAEVTNFRELVKAVANGQADLDCLEPNITVLNGLARRQQKIMAIPGVKAVSTSSMKATGR
jgi:hypothetical protein